MSSESHPFVGVAYRGMSGSRSASTSGAPSHTGGKGARGPVDARFVHIWTVTDGKVSRYEQLADTRRFCDAVGKENRSADDP
jgi:ketosteroid isomerase-like protein